PEPREEGGRSSQLSWYACRTDILDRSRPGRQIRPVSFSVSRAAIAIACCGCAAASPHARPTRRRSLSSEKSLSFPSRLAADAIEALAPHMANGSTTPAALSRIAEVIRDQFGTDVCSIYLLEPDRANLVLAATAGLRPDSVGRVRMLLTEGLAGLVAEELKPLRVVDAHGHPRFKFFPDAGEEAYRSFAGVPVLDRGVLQGVLVLQTARPHAFEDVEIEGLASVAALISSHVAAARTQGQLVASTHQRR